MSNVLTKQEKEDAMFEDLKDRLLDHLNDHANDIVSQTSGEPYWVEGEEEEEFDYDTSEVELEISLKLIYKGKEVATTIL